MEIDHFNPKLAKNIRNRYENLYLATRHCNGAKTDTWPDAKDRALGLRFLDPCTEADYGEHIFEDPDTFEVWGDSPAGRFHVRELDLNAPHLIKERKDRHRLRLMWKNSKVIGFKGTPGLDDAATLAGLRTAREQIEAMIPDIPQKKKPPFQQTN